MTGVQKLPSSYINITAAESSEAEFIPYTEIQAAIAHRDKMTFLKLMWTTSANAALYSQRLDEIENNRQQLKKQTDSFSLALSELEQSPPKDMSEEQLLARTTACKEMNEVLNKTMQRLNIVNQEITYFDDYNEDRQLKFRQKMSVYYQKLEAIIEEKIDLMLEYFKKNNIIIDKPEAEIRAVLKSALHDPALQEAYIKAAGQERSSFTDKLKGWFKS